MGRYESSDRQAGFTAEEISSLIYGLGKLFEDERCSGFKLDEEEDRARLSGIVAHWLLSDKVQLQSPEKILPQAKHRLGFNVMDAATGEHIIRLTMDRTPEMNDGDFLQLQNFFWTTVGRAIRDNQDIMDTLKCGGVHVEVEPPIGYSGQQYAD